MTTASKKKQTIYHRAAGVSSPLKRILNNIKINVIFRAKKSKQNVIKLLIHIWILNSWVFSIVFVTEKLYHIYINAIETESVFTQARYNSIILCWQQPCDTNQLYFLHTDTIYTKFFKLKCEFMGIAYLNCIRNRWFDFQAEVGKWKLFWSPRFSSLDAASLYFLKPHVILCLMHVKYLITFFAPRIVCFDVPWWNFCRIKISTHKFFVHKLQLNEKVPPNALECWCILVAFICGDWMQKRAINIKYGTWQALVVFTHVSFIHMLYSYQ